MPASVTTTAPTGKKARSSSGKTSLRLLLAAERRATLSVSDGEFLITFDDGRSLHYDFEGRLMRICAPDSYSRRSLSHQIVETRKSASADGKSLLHSMLAPDAADTVVADTQVLVSSVRHELVAGWADVEQAKPSLTRARERIQPLLDRAAAFDVPAARRDAEHFRALYGRVPVLPPDKASALLLQLTEGCRSDCTFCDAYRNVQYRLKNNAQFRQHVEEAIAYHGGGLQGRHSIFLGEANSLSAPLAVLRAVFKTLREHFHFAGDSKAGDGPAMDGVAGFLDADTGARRPLEEWRELRTLGLTNVYMGMETGDGTLLRWLHKPATPESIRRCVEHLKQARLSVGLVVLLGAGGRQYYGAHVRETAKLLSELPLGKGDHIYFSQLELGANAPYALHTMAAGIECLTDVQMHDQEQAIRKALRFQTRRGQPELGRYELENFVY